MVAPNWNPHSPGKVGVEHRDVGYGQTLIDAPADTGELQWAALRTGAIDTFELFTGQGAVAPPLDGRYNGLGRPMILDLVAHGAEASGPISISDFTVSAVTGGTGMFNENLTTPITAARLNTFNDGQYVTSNVLGSSFDAQFSTGAFPLDRHVLAVEVWANINLTTRIRRVDPAAAPWYYDIPAFSSSFTLGSLRMGEAIVDGTDTAWRHWTPQMIRDFASAGTRKIRVYCQAGPGYWKIDRLYLRVYWQPERRRGVGIGIPATRYSWIPFAMTTPNATGAPAVTLGENLALIARRITDYSVDTVAPFTVLPWRYLRGRSPDGNWRRHTQPFNVFTGMGAAGAQVDGIPMVRAKSAGTVVADAMPYDISRGALCYGAETVSQFLTMAGGGTVYGQAFVVAGWNASVGRPAAPLRAEVYRVSDGVRVFSPVEATAADVSRLPVTAPESNADDGGRTFKTVVFRFPESTALSAGQYELRFSSTASLSTRPWYIAALIGAAHTTNQTFGGSTDHADGIYETSGTTAELTSAGVTSDVLAQLVEVPAAVTGVGTSVGSVTAHHAEVCDPNAGCDGCADDTMPYVQVTWSPAPSGNPDVAGYQVDRMDDLDPDWERVAYVSGRLTTTWNDHEARIGVASQYHVRVIRTDDVTGDWSAPATVFVPPGQVALTFSSNAATGMGCVYPEVWSGREAVRSWDPLEFRDVSLRRIYGRNRAVAFRPIERAGDRFERTLLLNALCSVARPSMATFDPLRDLAWAPIPYVCIRDGEGNRWFSSVTLSNLTNRRADASGTELWTLDMSATDVADHPAVHDTSVAQVEGPATL